MPVGNVTSNDRGSGARYNDDKPPLDLIPPIVFLKAYETEISDLDFLDGLDVTNALLGLSSLYHGEVDSFREVLGDLNRWLVPAAEVLDYGRKKYAPWNWAKGSNWSVPVACALRHLVAVIQGEDTDEESGLHHLAHAYCNLIMLSHYIDYYPEGNDLPDPSVAFRIITLRHMKLNEDREWAEVGDYDEALSVRRGRDDCDGL